MMQQCIVDFPMISHTYLSDGHVTVLPWKLYIQFCLFGIGPNWNILHTEYYTQQLISICFVDYIIMHKVSLCIILFFHGSTDLDKSLWRYIICMHVFNIKKIQFGYIWLIFCWNIFRLPSTRCNGMHV